MILPSRREVGSLQPDPWVKHGIGDVYGEVGQHDRGRGKQHDAHDHQQALLGDSVDGGTQAGQAL